MALTRYNIARDAIETMFRESREVTQNACLLSYTLKEGRTMIAQEWRHEVAYRTLLLLRTAIVVVDYPENQIVPWTIPELNGIEAADVKNNLLLTNTQQQRWVHGSLTLPRQRNDLWEETLRVPIRVEYLLRKSVHSNNIRLTEPIPIQLELKILGSIDNFMNGYYNMRKFLTTVCAFILASPSCILLNLGFSVAEFLNFTLTTFFLSLLD
jgi:hypothetical protein